MDENIAENMIAIKIYCYGFYYDELTQKLKDLNKNFRLMIDIYKDSYVLCLDLPEDEYLMLKLTYAGIPEIDIKLYQSKQ